MRFLLLSLLLTSFLGWTSEICPLPNISNLPVFDAIEEALNEEILNTDPLVDIKTEKYKKNSKKADYCKRPVEMVDTVVLHHSEGYPTDSAQKVNQIHIEKPQNGVWWYMIAYGFVINTPYPGEKKPEPRVTEGRPMDIVSGSQGSNAYVPMDEIQQNLWDQGAITCGFEGKKFTKNPKQVNAKGEIKANITTVGIVINGNYSVFSKKNINGYDPNKPRYLTEDSKRLVARTICQLQKEYPRLKYVKYHSYYTPTACPGTIEETIPEIIEIAKEYKCEFSR